MSWVKIDDKAWSHPKMAGLSGNAVRLWIFALCWSASQGTDGQLPRVVLKIVSASKRDARQLVEAGLWTETEDGWAIHDYLTYQPSAAETKARREAKAQAGRKGGRRSGETRREAKPKQVLQQNRSEHQAGASRLVEAKRSPEPEPEPEPPAAAQQKRALRNLDEALRVPIRDRAQSLVDEEHRAEWLQPHRWPELQALAQGFSDALGWTKPRLTKPTSSTVLGLVHLLAAFEGAELERAIEAAPSDKWLTSGRKGLGSLSVEVVSRLLNPQRSERKPGTNAHRQPDYDGEPTFRAADLFAEDQAAGVEP